MAGFGTILHGLLLAVVLPGLQASCSVGRFGEFCRYSCNCQVCDQVTGSCPGSCSAGWVKRGQLCQKQNIAYKRRAWTGKATLFPHWPPSNAVDGDNDIRGGDRTCFHGEPGKNHLAIDLGRKYKLYLIRLYLRYQYNHRIANSYIFLDGDRSRVCYTFPPKVPNNPTDVVCDAEARHLTIENPGNDSNIQNTPLSICEVEIYQCSPGTYGVNCTNFCHCNSCDGTTGVCTGDCFAGWKGDRCDIECVDSYGFNCNMTCWDRKCAEDIASCDRYTGSCDPCLSGWEGVDCTKKCDRLHYGPKCALQCVDRHCTGKDSSCNHVTGRCDQGCLPGWHGKHCTEGCKGTYGLSCINSCAARRCRTLSSSCDPVHGECDDGCLPGWTGAACTTAPSIRAIVLSTTVGVLVVIIVILAVIIIRMRRRQLSSDKTPKDTNPDAPGASSTPDHIYTDVTPGTINTTDTTNTTDNTNISTTPAHYESFQMTEDNQYTGLKGQNTYENT